ncbi:hypothetical protein E4U57_005086 [Claviceps arundinis]|uniref:Ig-like domain-containing protein n=1 Tax=Claviceps arundinis TaxID=1623583 RepID=A0A9P7N2E2_9HYPO|nr:hypothetical protein E4U57_005086 [Claviceps arundinis]KAG5978378.1 hypothetical protein E4U56_002877 [Claviceps arundinis]
MASHINDPDEFVVLVTGFLPFQQKFPVNPSWEIAKGLPSRLQPLRAKDAADNTNGGEQTIDLPSVRILVHPEPLPVRYKPVRDLVPSLWDDTHQGRKVDAVVHIGMAGPRTSYLVERRAHRRGYRNVDVDCKLPEEGMDGRPNDPDWIWYDQPDELVSDLDIDDVHARWQACSSKDMDLRISEDAGHFLCDWVYYCSLSHLMRSKRPKKACFLHVPCDTSDEQIRQGREVTLNLIRAIAESEMSQRQSRNRDT